MEKFKSSPLADNTMVVITADHATYCDEDFRNTFPDYYRADMSCDEIPLLIYYKGNTGQLNAQGRNSLDLAPTVLDLLNIGYPESFMGDSLYRAKNERTAMDSFFWCQGKILYTGNDCVSVPEADMKSFASKNIAKYFAKK
jgi:phosphoglycerol transferase MdoB-like AlkP superfamily enzyme